MSKKFLTEHLNQVFTHRRNSVEKKLAEQNALLPTNPPNSQQNENAALKEQQDRIAQEQLILKAKQAMTIRENEVYRLQQESATKERIVCEQLQKEKEQVAQQVIALRIEQEKISREKIALREEQDAIEQEAFRERQQIREALELEREQLAREKMLLIAEQKKAEERINESMQELAVRNEEALREGKQNIDKRQEAVELNLKREKIVTEQQVQNELEGPVLEGEDEDYYFVPLAGEDNN